MLIHVTRIKSNIHKYS